MFPRRRLLHIESPRVLPRGVAQVLVLRFADGLHQHVARLAFRRLDAQHHLDAGLAAEQFPLVAHAQRVRAVDAANHLAFLDQRIGPGQRRRGVRQIRIVRVDVLHHESTGLLIAAQARAQRSHSDVVFRLSLVAAMDEGVQRRQLTDHLRNHIVQFIAIRDAIDQGQIPPLHRDPVHAMHVPVVEVVAFQPPRVEKEAVELIPRRRRHLPVRQIDLRLRHGLRVVQRRALHVRVKDVEVVGFVNQHFFAVERNLKSLHVRHHRVRLIALVVDARGTGASSWDEFRRWRRASTAASRSPAGYRNCLAALEPPSADPQCW